MITIVKVPKERPNYHITIPTSARQLLGIADGDLLEARVERGKMTIAPKTVIDRDLAESFEDFKKGRAFGPFTSHEQFLNSLHGEAKKVPPETEFLEAS
ncbi:MAG: AbrB/MazE/SpoVT family DNA-binding domain-containing protein [Bryobacteraceae bacterium]